MIPGDKFAKILVYLTKLPSFPKMYTNTIPFATVNFPKFKPEFLFEWEAPSESPCYLT